MRVLGLGVGGGGGIGGRVPFGGMVGGEPESDSTQIPPTGGGEYDRLKLVDVFFVVIFSGFKTYLKHAVAFHCFWSHVVIVLILAFCFALASARLKRVCLF